MIDRDFLRKLRSRGEEVLTQISAELMSNPRFVKAMEGAIRGREKLEQAAAGALREMNVPTRNDLRRANSRIEALERDLAQLRQRLSRGAVKPAARGAGARSSSGRAAPPRRSARRAATRRSRRGSGGGQGE
jgi:polyhydroxyalkanoate synthesis regulator phasin